MVRKCVTFVSFSDIDCVFSSELYRVFAQLASGLLKITRIMALAISANKANSTSWINELAIVICICIDLSVLWTFLPDTDHDILRATSYASQWFAPFSPPVVRNTSQHPFEWTRIFRDNHQIILDEILQFQSKWESTLNFQMDEVMPSVAKGEHNKDLNEGKGWKIIMLRCYGVEHEVEYPSTWHKSCSRY